MSKKVRAGNDIQRVFYIHGDNQADRHSFTALVSQHALCTSQNGGQALRSFCVLDKATGRGVGRVVGFFENRRIHIQTVIQTYIQDTSLIEDEPKMGRRKRCRFALHLIIIWREDLLHRWWDSSDRLDGKRNAEYESREDLTNGLCCTSVHRSTGDRGTFSWCALIRETKWLLNKRDRLEQERNGTDIFWGVFEFVDLKSGKMYIIIIITIIAATT